MTFALIYWILMLLWLVFGLAPLWGFTHPYATIGSTLLMFILFLLLGWHVFGSPVRP